MIEFTWETCIGWAHPTLELTAREGGGSEVVGWLILDHEEFRAFEYVNATQDIEELLWIEDVTREEAKRVVEAAVRLRCDVTVKPANNPIMAWWKGQDR